MSSSQVAARTKDFPQAAMDQARSTITKIFNGEPHSYTRFNLTQNMEGDNSHVEMRLSSDADEEAGGNRLGAQLNHNSNRRSYVTSKFGRTPKNLCVVLGTVLLILIIGYLIGYLVHRKRDLAPSCEASVKSSDERVEQQTGAAAPLMAWNDVKNAFARKLSASNFQKVFRDFSSGSHRAGSSSDDALADKLIKKFQEYGLKTWTDEHFIKVQDSPLRGSNKVVFNNDSEERPEGFLSYSANGKVEGAVLYAHYGQESDFRSLQSRNINMSGRVMLIRAGRISFAEKVANAAKMKASAVLIYRDPIDYPSGDATQLFGHVHLGSGDPYTPGFPSFNHTQFPPAESSGLPNILAQTITPRTASGILGRLEGPNAQPDWGVFHKLGSENDLVTVEVNNVLTEKKINNVFGVIEGFVDADRYLVLGAQRDAWGPGFASSTVGTGVLLEMARSISDMLKKDGFKPRRSLVFASWSAGEYGSVGATEWLEGYLSSLSTKAFTYINLDGIVAGHTAFKVAASPMMYGLIERTLKEVGLQNIEDSLFSQFGKGNWESNVLEPLKLENAAYPFMAFSGIPSLSFRFTSGNMKRDAPSALLTAGVAQIPPPPGLSLLRHLAGHAGEADRRHVQPAPAAGRGRRQVRGSHRAQAGPRPPAADGPAQVRQDHSGSRGADQQESHHCTEEPAQSGAHVGAVVDLGLRLVQSGLSEPDERHPKQRLEQHRDVPHLQRPHHVGGEELAVGVRVRPRKSFPPRPAGLRSAHAERSVGPPGRPRVRRPRGRRGPVPQPVCLGDLDHSGLRQRVSRGHVVLR
ncbi:transferrin receptor 1a isoform X3 [Syngnathoides biaculeatus]|uniref:transferrin receptor 1a isoform X3 n=1 Tax=Syngnathoides biaculeatus TaxID=300417 RepID=UPI002ADE14AF|nr:transferrin receptor 1a isoform X3 [Syngnathoides biaculeatus]